MFGDSSPRTKKVARSAYWVIASLIILMISIVSFFSMNSKYNTIVAKSSHPIGSELYFPRSDASLAIKDIYTDKNEDVLIVRIANNSETSSRLPYKGTDYRIFLSSKSLDGYKEAPILFGRMSTDGDMFLIIPKPAEEVYTVFIMNTKYLAPIQSAQVGDDVQNIDPNTGQNDEEIEQSLSQALSDYQYRPGEQSKTIDPIQSNKADIATFRLTKNPAFDTPAYNPKVLDASLMNGDKFEFEKFFDVIFKESALNRLQIQSDKLTQQSKQYIIAKKEAQDRLESNANDQLAKSQLIEIEENEQTIKNKQSEIAAKMAAYSKLKFTSELFGDLQTKAKIIPSK